MRLDKDGMRLDGSLGVPADRGSLQEVEGAMQDPLTDLNGFVYATATDSYPLLTLAVLNNHAEAVGRLLSCAVPAAPAAAATTTAAAVPKSSSAWLFSSADLAVGSSHWLFSSAKVKTVDINKGTVTVLVYTILTLHHTHHTCMNVAMIGTVLVHTILTILATLTLP
jgi:hypothetical protein